MASDSKPTGAPTSEDVYRHGVKVILATSEELVGAPTVEEVCHRMVAACRDRLGVERCGLYLAEGSGLRGTFGISIDGQVVDESRVYVPDDHFGEMCATLMDLDPADRWEIYEDEELIDYGTGTRRVVGKGQVAATLLWAGRNPIGAFFNDNAMSGKPLNPEFQRIIALYCSFASSIIINKRISRNATDQAALFRDLFEQSPSANFIVSPSGRFLACNEAFARLFQLEGVEQALGQAAQDLFGEDLFEILIERTHARRWVRNFETDVVLPTGKRLSLNFNTSACHGADGSLVGVQGFLLDNTGQKRAERAVRQLDISSSVLTEREFYHEVVRRVCIALDVSAAFLFEHEMTADGGVFLPLDSILRSEETQPLPESLLDAIATELPLAQFCHRVEETHRIEVSGFTQTLTTLMSVPVVGARGETLGAVGVLHHETILEDSRARALLQIFASRASAEIQRRRAEAFIKKSQTDLVLAQKMEAVGLLAGGIAHDFNNILTSILGIVDLALLDVEKDTRLAMDLDEIRKSANRAAGLTRQLLAFSRKQVLQPEVINLCQLLRSQEKILRSMLGEHIVLETVLPEAPAYIRADAGQVEQTILNIVVNARDAMANGGRLTIRVSFFTHEEDGTTRLPVSPGRYIVLAISDTGEGMTPEVRDRIFDPYFTTKPKEKGTGLGLSLVYGVVKQSKGFVQVDSQEGRGSVFTIFLPEVEERSSRPDTPTPAVERLEGIETILLVEDDEAVRLPIKASLLRYGYNVLEAKSPGEGLLICERYRSPIPLMITDVIMPHMNGYELWERVAPLRPDMRVIFISGYSDEVISKQGVLKEGVNFLQKPFPHHVLLRKVREVLDSAPASG